MMMADTISSLGWSFDFAKTKTKMLEGGVLSHAMSEVLLQAKDSNDKLNKEALKLMTKLSDTSPHYGSVKKGITTMEKNLHTINHVLQWQEMPDETVITKDKFDKMIFSIAESTEKMNELIMSVKGALKAKLNWST